MESSLIKVHFFGDHFSIYDTNSAYNCITICGVYGENLSYFASKRKRGPSKLPVSLANFEYYFLLANYSERLETYVLEGESWVKWTPENGSKAGLQDVIVKAQSSCEYLVYSILRKKGYFVTGGIKFGSDFLVYESEPSTSHSVYILRIVEDRFTISTQAISSYCRLATTVKKKFVIAIIKNVATSMTKTVSFICFEGCSSLSSSKST